jgi:hypothetical protein
VTVSVMPVSVSSAATSAFGVKSSGANKRPNFQQRWREAGLKNELPSVAARKQPGRRFCPLPARPEIRRTKEPSSHSRNYKKTATETVAPSPSSSPSLPRVPARRSRAPPRRRPLPRTPTFPAGDLSLAPSPSLPRALPSSVPQTPKP